MREFEVNVSPGRYQEIVSGVRTFLLVKRGRYEVNDKLTLREKKGDLLTGRNVQVQITDIYSGEPCSSEFSIVSFQILFPATEPRIPVAVFMQQFNNFCELRREHEALKESI